MLAFADRVSDGMFQLHPANVRQYDPAWMTDRLDEILDMVPSSAIAARNAAKSPGKKSRAPTAKTNASPATSRGNGKWADEPGSPRRNRRPKRGDAMSVQSVPATDGDKLYQGQEEEEEEEEEGGSDAYNSTQQPPDDGGATDQGQVATSKFAAEVLSLRTGDDVIKFFARHGDECPVRFFYLKRAAGSMGGVKIRPYDLDVVMAGPIADSDLEFPPLPFALEREECFTMSPKGVVHVEPGHPSEFIVLSSWIRSATIFNVLTSIPFFKNYRIFKLFHAWRRNALYQRFRKLQSRVASRLFLAKPTFCEPLLKVSGFMHDIAQVNLLELKVPSSMAKALTNIRTYTDYQASRRLEGKKIIEARIEDCHRVVERLTASVMMAAREAALELEQEASGELMDRADFGQDEDDDSGSEGDDEIEEEGEEGLDGGGAGKSKDSKARGGRRNARKRRQKKKKKKFSSKNTTSIAKQKEAHQRRVMALRHATHEQGLLVDFVRLADTYEVILLANRAAETAKDLLTELSREDRLQGLFETSVRFSVSDGAAKSGEQAKTPSTKKSGKSALASVGGKVRFEPNVTVVVQSLETLLSNTVSAFGDISRLLRVRVPSLARRVRIAAQDPERVADIVLGKSPEFGVYSKAISEQINKDFSSAELYARTFECVRPIYRFERSWDFEAFKKNATDLSSIKKGIQSTRAMERTLNMLRVTNSIGVITVETRDLKRRLMPTITSIMDDMKSVLVDTARDGCVAATELLTKQIVSMELTPQTSLKLDKFAEAVRALRTVNSTKEQLDEDTSAVEEMFRLLHTLEVKVSHVMAVQLDDMRAVSQSSRWCGSGGERSCIFLMRRCTNLFQPSFSIPSLFSPLSLSMSLSLPLHYPQRHPNRLYVHTRMHAPSW
jgi:dynein heavy chain